MVSLWQVIVRPRNRRVLLGGWRHRCIGRGRLERGDLRLAGPREPNNCLCAQQGSIVAGRNASGNTINYTGAAPGAGTVATPCAEVREMIRRARPRH